MHPGTCVRHDYCNAVLYSVSAKVARQLQAVLAAAWLITSVHRNQHITATLRDTLHCLPVSQRIVFKIALMAFDCVHSQGPGYFDGVMTPVHTVAAQTRLRSADYSDMVVPGSVQLGLASAASPQRHQPSGTIYHRNWKAEALADSVPNKTLRLGYTIVLAHNRRLRELCLRGAQVIHILIDWLIDFPTNSYKFWTENITGVQSSRFVSKFFWYGSFSPQILHFLTNIFATRSKCFHILENFPKYRVTVAPICCDATDSKRVFSWNLFNCWYAVVFVMLSSQSLAVDWWLKWTPGFGCWLLRWRIIHPAVRQVEVIGRQMSRWLQRLGLVMLHQIQTLMTSRQKTAPMKLKVRCLVFEQIAQQ